MLPNGPVSGRGHTGYPGISCEESGTLERDLGLPAMESSPEPFFRSLSVTLSHCGWPSGPILPATSYDQGPIRLNQGPS